MEENTIQGIPAVEETMVFEEQPKKVVFISGNTDLNDKKFLTYYGYQIAELAKLDNYYFNISDEDGCSAMLQSLFDKLITDKSRVNIFYIGTQPKNLLNKEFVTIGGFRTLEERNAGMTMSSNMDYHVALEGVGKSAVLSNICRRHMPEYDYMKHWVTGNQPFWNLFTQKEDKVS